MKLFLSGAAALLLLSGCDTRPIESLGYAERMELATEITARCTEMGIDPASPQMIDCQRAEVEAESAKRAEWRTANAAAAGSLQSYGASQQAYATRSTPLRCTSSPLGTSVNTTCY